MSLLNRSLQTHGLPTAFTNHSLHFLSKQNKLRHDLLLVGQRLEVCRILRVSLPTGWTQAVLIRSNAMPTKTTNLITAGARIEVQVVNFQGLHTQRALKGKIGTEVSYFHPTDLFTSTACYRNDFKCFQLFTALLRPSNWGFTSSSRSSMSSRLSIYIDMKKDVRC